MSNSHIFKMLGQINTNLEKGEFSKWYVQYKTLPFDVANDFTYDLDLEFSKCPTRVLDMLTFCYRYSILSNCYGAIYFDVFNDASLFWIL